ncbi:hypothetical protein, partial [uncultured Megasphaera sp.]|uniref:hypothetical protein n=1 Tax=uncultured Megasphaera sp. TaxID=165188 RepID=UPI00261D9460
EGRLQQNEQKNSFCYSPFRPHPQWGKLNPALTKGFFMLSPINTKYKKWMLLGDCYLKYY